MSKSTIHFIVQHRRDRSPGQRFRHEQYLSALEDSGFRIRYSPLLNAEQDKVLYKPGNYFRKAQIFFASYRKRQKDLDAIQSGDIVFIYREALLSGDIRFEKAFRRKGAKLVYDFDDAIWIPSVSEANKLLQFLKRPGKVGEIAGISDLVIVGNEYLAAYAKKFNPNVVIIPTTIDLEEYHTPITYPEKPVVTIGWSGSLTTIQHFAHAIPALTHIKAEFGDKVHIEVIGDGNYRHEPLGIVGKPWRKETELKDLAGMDIGIMPLPDDQWSRGKCGLKGLQYMSLGIPTLMSPVGVNAEIVHDGVNGFLPATTEEWVKRLKELIQDRALRERLGQAGLETVRSHYSSKAWAEPYVKLFTDLVP